MDTLGVVTRDTVIYLACTIWDLTDSRQLALHGMQSTTILDEACRRLGEFYLDARIAGGAFGYPESSDTIELEARFTDAAGVQLSECRWRTISASLPTTPARCVSARSCSIQRSYAGGCWGSAIMSRAGFGALARADAACLGRRSVRLWLRAGHGRLRAERR